LICLKSNHNKEHPGSEWLFFEPGQGARFYDPDYDNKVQGAFVYARGSALVFESRFFPKALTSQIEHS